MTTIKQTNGHYGLISLNIMLKFSLAALFAVSVFFAVASPVFAESQGYTPICPFNQQQGRIIVNFLPLSCGKIVSSGTIDEATCGPQSASIPQGTYSVSLASYDGYDSRINVFQPHEQWKAVFYKNGSSIATSSAISDLADCAEEASTAEVVDQALVISKDTDSVSALHAFWPDNSSANSVEAVCLALDAVNLPQCSDGVDNDGDGLVDYPNDPGCDSPDDNDENQAPVITLLGDNPINLTVGDTFTDPGATATDTEDGDITSDIVVGGDTVDTSAVGTYTITYNVSDSDGATADEVLRTVEMSSPSTPPPSPPSGCVSNCGGGGGGGGGTPIHLEITNEKVEYAATSTVLVTWDTNLQATSSVLYGLKSYASSTKPFNEYEFSTATTSVYATSHSVTISGLKSGVPYYFRPLAGRTDEEVGGIELSITLPKLPEETPIPSTCNYLLEYIKLGGNNNPDEVRKLQVFLRDFEGFSSLAVTGIYDKASFDAVSEFQKKHRKDILDPWALKDSTGYVYITTKKEVNEIYCQKQFPLTKSDLVEIERYNGLIRRLRAEHEAGSIPAGEEIKKIRKEIGDRKSVV